MSKDNSKSKKTTLIIALLVVISVVCIAAGVWVMTSRNSQAPLIPDYAPVETEKNASRMDDSEQEKMDKPEGGGSVSLNYSKEIRISLTDKTASLYFGNPAKSNEDMLIQLLVQDTEIARSGTIEPGFQVTSLDLDDQAVSRLQAGTYEGLIKVFYYDGQTNEKAILNTEIPVSIEVSQ